MIFEVTYVIHIASLKISNSDRVWDLKMEFNGFRSKVERASITSSSSGNLTHLDSLMDEHGDDRSCDMDDILT